MFLINYYWKTQSSYKQFLYRFPLKIKTVHLHFKSQIYYLKFNGNGPVQSKYPRRHSTLSHFSLSSTPDWEIVCATQTVFVS